MKRPEPVRPRRTDALRRGIAADHGTVYLGHFAEFVRAIEQYAHLIQIPGPFAYDRQGTVDKMAGRILDRLEPFFKLFQGVVREGGVSPLSMFGAFGFTVSMAAVYFCHDYRIDDRIVAVVYYFKIDVDPPCLYRVENGCL
jgi:hypothetical protein